MKLTVWPPEYMYINCWQFDFDRFQSFEIWPGKSKSLGHVYSSRCIYSTRYGMCSLPGGEVWVGVVLVPTGCEHQLPLDTKLINWHQNTHMSEKKRQTVKFLWTITKWGIFHPPPSHHQILKFWDPLSLNAKLFSSSPSLQSQWMQNKQNFLNFCIRTQHRFCQNLSMQCNIM